MSGSSRPQADMKLLSEDDKSKQYFIDALDYYRKINSPFDIAELEALIRD